MKILGIDQSLSKCAFCITEEGEPKTFFLSKTGKSTVKTKRKDTTYYSCLHEQIEHLCGSLNKVVNTHNPDKIVFEALSFASSGNASRDLACLYGAMRYVLKTHPTWDGEVTEVPPTSLKSYAHGYLPESLKWDGMTKAKKPKKVKMDKKLMVAAARNINGDDFLNSHNYSSGLDDLTDAFFLAHREYYLGKEDNEEEKT